MQSFEVDTPHGPARVHLHAGARTRGAAAAAAPRPPGALVLGHGAGGGVDAPDLKAVTRAATGRGYAVALVEQPYRVAGRRSPAPAGQLDAAWTAVCEHLRAHELEGLGLIAGGRSSGARVACRTAAATGAKAVLCLAFPLVPPRRASGRPPQSRLPELEAVTVPVLIVQGEGDPFGMPPEGPARAVVKLRGNHSLRSDMPGLTAAVGAWLDGMEQDARATLSN